MYLLLLLSIDSSIYPIQPIFCFAQILAKKIHQKFSTFLSW
nr:MAG TPA: hypothetical protein [Caudoviricetes sp.]